MSENMPAKVLETNANVSDVLLQKWGGVASFLMAMAFIVAPSIHLFGNLREPFGAAAYDLADFLYGPVWGASLVTAVFALRERIGERAPRRMTLALLAACLAAGAMVAVACIRSANRHYHMTHPDLHLETSSTVLIVWTTLVQGMTTTALHFWGWSLMLIGSAAWASRRLPRILSALYLLTGISALFVFLLPNDSDVNAVVFGIVVSIWQGILLLKGDSGEARVPQTNTSQSESGVG